MRHLAQQREDQRPGQLGGRAGQAAGAADRDAPTLPPPATSIDALAAPVVTSSRRCRQPAQQLGVERRPLAHHDHDVGAADPPDERVAEQVLVHEVDVAAEPAPVGVRRGAPLPVVQHRDLHRQTSGSNRHEGPP